MKTACLSLIFGLATLAASAQPATPGPTQPASPVVEDVGPKLLAFTKPIEAADGDSALTKKLKERHNSAAALLGLRVEEYKKGLRPLDAVFEAARLASDAKLELTPNAKDRLGVMEAALELLKLAEDRIAKQLERGFGSRGDLERARYARLSAEVEVLKLKEPVKP